MFDPKGDMPWSEDVTANNVLHLNNPKVDDRFQKIFSSKRRNLGSSTCFETKSAVVSHVLRTLVWILQTIETSFC